MTMSGFELGAQHGKKRAPEDDLEGEQPLTKRFDRLQLNYRHGILGKLSSTISAAQDDQMRVDDTKDKVYIHDLDAELADIEDQEPHIEFLPEIDKKLAAFPSLLESRPLLPSQSQLVLYRPISFPEEVHNARKAIIEARKRARERQNGQKSTHLTEQHCDMDLHNTHTVQEPQVAEICDNDPDAMDIG